MSYLIKSTRNNGELTSMETIALGSTEELEGTLESMYKDAMGNAKYNSKVQVTDIRNSTFHVYWGSLDVRYSINEG